jgi:hypothetical protein
MIFDIEINEQDQPSFKNTPKQLYSYIKSQQNENTGIAPLRSEGTLHSNPYLGFRFFFLYSLLELRNKSWKPECVGSFNMDWRILGFYPEPEARNTIY